MLSGTTGEPLITAAELARLSVEAPRYTSYPTAAEFSESVGPQRFAEALQRADQAGGKAPIALYVHLPFCRELCDFCGCHALVAKTAERVSRYVRVLEQEMELVAAHLRRRRVVGELHFGGGSPSLLEVDDFDALMSALRRRFVFDARTVISIEVDPRTVTAEKFKIYRKWGVRRVSMGFQDLDPDVQVAIGRNQSADVSHAAYHRAREAGFDSVNIDLCYGLPRQTEATFRATVEDVLALRPNRIAIFGYAHVPWLKPLQRRIDAATLPPSELRFRLIAGARERLTQAGYRAIGIDHYGLPDDELTVALDGGRLHRNFQGYTTTATDALIGLGLSSISDAGGVLAQSDRSLHSYYEHVEHGRLPTERGAVRSQDDIIRGYIIEKLMCTFALDVAGLEGAFGVDFEAAFAPEIEDLRTLERDGLVTLCRPGVQLTALGRVFARNVAVVFDSYRRRSRAEARAGALERKRFSSTI